jgi:hypothetical protein
MSSEMSDFQGWPIAEAIRRVPDLQHHLAHGRLLGWGRLGNPNHTAAPIPASSWSGKIELSKISKSNKPDAICDEKSLFDVSVFPVLLAPNVVEQLGFLSLKDAFSRFVIGDPEVQHLGKIAGAAVPQFMDIYREGRCFYGYYWPMSTDDLISLGEPDPQAENFFGYRSTVQTDLAQRALRIRYQALLNLLRSRRLLAEGDPVRPNDPQQILSSIWASPSYYFGRHKRRWREIPSSRSIPFSVNLLRSRSCRFSNANVCPSAVASDRAICTDCPCKLTPPLRRSPLICGPAKPQNRHSPGRKACGINLQ